MRHRITLQIRRGCLILLAVLRDSPTHLRAFRQPMQRLWAEVPGVREPRVTVAALKPLQDHVLPGILTMHEKRHRHCNHKTRVAAVTGDAPVGSVEPAGPLLAVYPTAGYDALARGRTALSSREESSARTIAHRRKPLIDALQGR
jgi:hypothetical protein